jgi:hypothetical protein
VNRVCSRWGWAWSTKQCSPKWGQKTGLKEGKGHSEIYLMRYRTCTEMLPVSLCTLLVFVFVFVFVFFMVIGFELRVLHLLGRCFTTWATLSVLFALGIFQVESHVYAQSSLDYHPSISTSYVAGMAIRWHYAQHLLFEMESLELFAWASPDTWPGPETWPSH